MIRVDGFDWDDGNREKCRKHGVAADEIEAVFEHGPRVAPDPGHSSSEARFIAVGPNRQGRLLFVAFTWRERAGRRLLRPISARYMHAKEVRAYEAGS
jgi:uncharacterized DUF497 family protein